MGNEKKKVHYAWYILGVCILINVIVQALVMQISSLYIVPMYNDLQVPRSLLSLQSVCITVGAVLTAPYWGKLYKKHGARKLLPGCVAVTALCTIGRSLMPNIWGNLAFVGFIFAKNQVAFYMMIVAYGLASGITSIMPTLLTSKIFGNRDYGPIYGMVVSVNRFGGVVGTLLVSLLYDITKNYSIIWPACVISMAFTLVATLGCMKLSRKKLAQEQQGKEQPA